jgi:Outer membrane protein beta-barrel domain
VPSEPGNADALKEALVSKKLFVSVSLLGALSLVPLNGQHNDFEGFNFNIGGGLTVPLNPTASFVGVNGSATTGAGANFNKWNSIEGDFMWNGLSPTVSLIQPRFLPTGSVNVFSLTGQYRLHADDIGHSLFGAYVIVGGGWYYRRTSVDRNFIVPRGTPCQPIYNWWGFACDSDGLVTSKTIASRGSSAGGVNGGAGFTIRIGDEGWKFFTEARYTYAWSQFIPTTFIPITFGFRFN